MGYSRRVSLGGLLIGVAGALQDKDAVIIGAFVIIAAGAICKAIEDKDT